jgi:hypothetical protein
LQAEAEYHAQADGDGARQHKPVVEDPLADLRGAGLVELDGGDDRAVVRRQPVAVDDDGCTLIIQVCIICRLSLDMSEFALTICIYSLTVFKKPSNKGMPERCVEKEQSD